MDQFSVDQIIGKTLVAKSNVPIKRFPMDDAPEVYTVKSGTTVGTVYSYLLPKTGRATVYWMFYDGNGRAYYAPHVSGMYDFGAIQQQGAMTVEQQKEAERIKNETIGGTVERVGTKWIIYGLVAVGIIILGKQIIEKKLK